MFAAQYSAFGPPSVLTTGPYPEPHAARGQVRIRVRAAGVSPVDAAVRAGRTGLPITFPHVPGVDAAGVIDEGPAELIGTEVFGSVDVSRLGGASAEFAVLAFWAAKPAAMPWEAAGAAGTSIETATRVLDLLGVQKGMSLVIDGAAGGVGSVTVQLAVARGARVTGTGSAANQSFIAALGATPVVYGAGLPARIGTADRAVDVAGAGSLADLITITGSPDSVVTIADFSAAELGVRLSRGDLAGEPDGRHGLAPAAALAGQGRFRVPMRAVFPLVRIAEAHELVTRGPRRGKIAVTVG
jgi:NADPH:quinone reductase-like Zn-dependent oxidoreductase